MTFIHLAEMYHFGPILGPLTFGVGLSALALVLSGLLWALFGLTGPPGQGWDLRPVMLPRSPEMGPTMPDFGPLSP